MLTDKELEIVIMELETEGLSPEVYRYRTKYGLSVMYYMFDMHCKCVDELWVRL